MSDQNDLLDPIFLQDDDEWGDEALEAGTPAVATVPEYTLIVTPGIQPRVLSVGRLTMLPEFPGCPIGKLLSAVKAKPVSRICPIFGMT